MGECEIKLSAVPDRMVNTGESKTRVVVDLREEDEPQSNSEVYIGTTLGSLYSLQKKSKSSIQKSKFGQIMTTQTDEEGQIAVGLNLPNYIGTVHLAAGIDKEDVEQALKDILSSVEGVSTLEVVLETGKPSKLTLETRDNQIVADGISIATITVTITDDFGNPISGQSVSFSTDFGTIDTDSLGSITDETGRAQVKISSREVGKAKISAMNRYRSWIEDLVPIKDEKKGLLSLFKESGSAKKKTESGEILEAEIALEFIASHINSLVLSVDESEIWADGNSKAEICAQVNDEFGNPISGQTIIFESDLGEIRPQEESVTNEEGKAFTYLTSKNVGTASVRAHTLGEKNLLSATQVRFKAASPQTIEITSGSEFGIADGVTEFPISVRVLDIMGNPVPHKNVEFKTDNGTFIPADERTTDNDGKTTLSITSKSAGRSKVEARCGDAEAFIDVDFEAGKPTSVALAINPTLEESWKERVPADHWERIKEALGHLEKRRFDEAVEILEAERERIEETVNLAALCDLAFAYQNSGRRKDAEKIYKSITKNGGSKREIRITTDGIEEVFGVTFPSMNGEEVDHKDYLRMKPRDFLINVVLTDNHGNFISKTPVKFETNFGWVPEQSSKVTTNEIGAATSIVTTFFETGSHELEFAWTNLGLIKENELDYEGAEKCYRFAIKSVRDSTRGLESLAQVLVKTGNTEEAKRCFYNLGLAYSKRGNYSRSIEYYSKAIELDPKYAKALSGCGSSYLRVGDYDRAKRYLEEAIKIDKSLKAALTNLGLYYHLTGKFEKAVRMCRRALRLDEEFKPALVVLYQVFMAKGERDKARDFAAKLNKLGG